MTLMCVTWTPHSSPKNLSPEVDYQTFILHPSSFIQTFIFHPTRRAGALTSRSGLSNLHPSSLILHPTRGGSRLLFPFFAQHQECYHARQDVCHEGSRYQQKDDEQTIKCRNAPHQHTGIEHRYDHHQGLRKCPYLR